MKRRRSPDYVISCVLIALTIVLIGLHGWLAFSQRLITDEFETIASARFIHEGRIIFKDFFQHHGSIAYVVYSSVFIFLTDLTRVVLAMRSISFFFLIIVVFVLFDLVKRISRAHPFAIGFISIFILLNDLIWWRYGAQIRPDAIMVLFLLMSIRALHNSYGRQEKSQLLQAGLLASLSFFCKQTSAIFLLVFIIFYFRNNFRKYFLFLLGMLPVLFIHVAYFMWHQALPQFVRYFVTFNISPAPFAAFSLRERLWFVFTPLLPVYFKAAIVLVLIGSVTALLYFYPKVRERGGPFFRAVFFCAFLGMLSTFCLKTPYPQYYMPVQIMFLITGAYYLDYLSQHKRAFTFLCSGMAVFALLTSTQFLVLKSAQGPGIKKQLSEVDSIARVLPKDARIIGAVPFMTVRRPSGFYWYYPPLFIDRSMDFLREDLRRADVVFYDTSLFLLAPREFKDELFSKWNFVGRFYLPFSNQGEHDPVSIFAKDKLLAERMKFGFAGLKLAQASPELKVLDCPVYIPLYFQANLETSSEAPVAIIGQEYRRDFNVATNAELSFIATTDRQYFDGVTNTVFPVRGELSYLLHPGIVRLSLEYREDLFFGARNELGLRKRWGNCPFYKGTVDVNFEPFSQVVTVDSVAGGYAFKIGLFSNKVEISIKARENKAEQ